MFALCPSCSLPVTSDQDSRTEVVPFYGRKLWIHTECPWSLDDYLATVHHRNSERFHRGIAQGKDTDMAQKVQVLLEDDLDGSEATQTVAFGLDGTNYEIDLNDDNASALRDALARYVGAARRSSNNRPARSGVRSNTLRTGNGPDPKLVREWAKANGYEVPERGRIGKEVTEAYEAAQSAPTPEPKKATGKKDKIDAA